MKVFLSHSTRDREFVQRLAAALGLRNTSAACSSILCVTRGFWIWSSITTKLHY